MGLDPAWEDPLEEEMATHSSISAWEIQWTEEPGGLQFLGSQRVGHNRGTKQQQQHVRLKRGETVESGFSCKRDHKTYAQGGCEK